MKHKKIFGFFTFGSFLAASTLPLAVVACSSSDDSFSQAKLDDEQAYVNRLKGSFIANPGDVLQPIDGMYFTLNMASFFGFTDFRPSIGYEYFYKTSGAYQDGIMDLTIHVVKNGKTASAAYAPKVHKINVVGINAINLEAQIRKIWSTRLSAQEFKEAGFHDYAEFDQEMCEYLGIEYIESTDKDITIMAKKYWNGHTILFTLIKKGMSDRHFFINILAFSPNSQRSRDQKNVNLAGELLKNISVTSLSELQLTNREIIDQTTIIATLKSLGIKWSTLLPLDLDYKINKAFGSKEISINIGKKYVESVTIELILTTFGKLDKEDEAIHNYYQTTFSRINETTMSRLNFQNAWIPNETSFTVGMSQLFLKLPSDFSTSYDISPRFYRKIPGIHNNFIVVRIYKSGTFVTYHHKITKYYDATISI